MPKALETFKAEPLIFSKPACPHVPLPCHWHHHPLRYPSEKLQLPFCHYCPSKTQFISKFCIFLPPKWVSISPIALHSHCCCAVQGSIIFFPGWAPIWALCLQACFLLSGFHTVNQEPLQSFSLTMSLSTFRPVVLLLVFGQNHRPAYEAFVTPLLSLDAHSSARSSSHFSSLTWFQAGQKIQNIMIKVSKFLY